MPLYKSGIFSALTGKFFNFDAGFSLHTLIFESLSEEKCFSPHEGPFTLHNELAANPCACATALHVKRPSWTFTPPMNEG